ncbi:MAG: HAMP domain-containing histidine kinase [bacterium]|nr:HAMP domain-containing histidine kinase [bacterium]MCM1375336.1 HAMP domain-containing histidine kinase [Muribaculum sp.]
MRSKQKLSPFLRIFILILALLFIAVIGAIGMFYYIFGITEPEGLSLASWPDRFTDNFSVWMGNDNGDITIEEIGLERLDEYGLWLQVIDETGEEVFCHNKPRSYPARYSASELISLRTSAYEQGNTVFVNSYENSGETWSYLIGFPYAIGKHMLYYNGENVGRLSLLFRMGIFFCLCAIILSGVFYGFWLTRQLGKIAKGIRNISMRCYTMLPEKGVFGDIYRSLNKMDTEIRRSDKVGLDTERIRREWIANITHDLKTPLSPIKGYAELLMDSPAPDSETVQEYGGIILKNANHTEKMINDLKLTYQLDSGAVPYHPQAIRLVRFLKELVIDIVNDPAFTNRCIEFENEILECEVCLDIDLFRRAVNNLIVNALTHNPPETKVTISIAADEKKRILICISDNGIGMSDTEQSELFNRYYRGTNTKEKPEGSGLGLAIAKQIIALHNGNISVKSKQGQGTRFTIVLPLAESIT